MAAAVLFLGVPVAVGAGDDEGDAQPPVKRTQPARQKKLNNRPMRDDAVFGDDDDAIADVIAFVVLVFRLAGR